MNGQISFNAPGGNVVGAGMRFGTSGPINVVPVSGAQGQTSGTLSVPFSLSASTCDNLSQVCHDIKCYEFAVTADGKISQANIRDVALMCGNCDEPSCKPLIVPPCSNDGPGEGSFSSSIASGTGTASCTSSQLGIVNSNWVLVISNAGSSGSSSFDPDFYTGGCSSCPAIQLSDASLADHYIGISGSGSWSGNVFSFSATLKSLDDVINGGGTTYSISGSINCN